jgi:nucleoside phosphorylase
MEGFAALRAAEIAGVRAVELRGISNRCGDRSRSDWNFAAGIAGLKRIVDAFFELQP